MHGEPEPELIESPLGGIREYEGVRLELSIFRLATVRGWTLEVVNENGTSIVWDDPFPTDREAAAAFHETLAREGIAAFLDSE